MAWLRSTSPRREAMGTFLCEISALLIVFPWLDQMLASEAFHFRYIVACWYLAVPTCVVGIALHKKSEGATRMNWVRFDTILLVVMLYVIAGFTVTCLIGEDIEQQIKGEVMKVLASAVGTIITIAICYFASHWLDSCESEEDPQRPNPK